MLPQQAGIFQGEVSDLMVMDVWQSALLRAFAKEQLEEEEARSAGRGGEAAGQLPGGRASASAAGTSSAGVAGQMPSSIQCGCNLLLLPGTAIGCGTGRGIPGQMLLQFNIAVTASPVVWSSFHVASTDVCCTMISDVHLEKLVFVMPGTDPC